MPVQRNRFSGLRRPPAGTGAHSGDVSDYPETALLRHRGDKPTCLRAYGGVAGRRVAVLTRDDGGDAKRAAENIREVIERDNVVAMLSGVEGGPCVATLKEASDRGVPLVACMAGSPEMREPFSRWSFPVRAAHLDEFDHLLGIVKTCGYSRVAFVHADSDTGRRHLANVRRLAGDRGIDVVPIAMTAGKAPAALADAIAAARVDAVFNHGSYSSTWESSSPCARRAPPRCSWR